ncbi:DUF1990 family protein [Frigoribacterium faeni]|uniref:DUF1990 domain-containing protein n=1 Tax=Frigoribacterium faeni TaxID=145483 RepID=A0A7W3JH06_9MICO|nr:DUF1990 domain-containing protein [Frigoribacterium faeni]MBA8812644.1 uncharacterized protein (UPF0548 family) [Frigoribacterium faeni]BFF13753.1 DUF1990 domain-containing protein [Microbacterium flavescens]GEK82343.1 DUF1990 domain-containing protein [Frigoribacterium faeni]
MRRATHTETRTTYGEVGATQAPDLMQYPPSGFTPAEYRTRVGHGDARFEAAWTATMTWQIQKRSGIEVRVDDVPSVEEGGYTPVTFDENGAPVDPAHWTRSPDESRFAPDGTPFLTAGTTATLTIEAYGRRVEAPVRVVYVIDEPKRKGFAYGTLDGHPESGEESWIVDQTDDGSVWLSIRSFSRPSSFRWKLVEPFMRRTQALYTRRYLRALSLNEPGPEPETDLGAAAVTAAESPETAPEDPTLRRTDD